MLITKTRIHSIDQYIAPFKKEDGLYVATEISSGNLEHKLKMIGFPILPEGEIVWEHVNQYAGNIQDASELVGQLQKHRFKERGDGYLFHE